MSGRGNPGLLASAVKAWMIGVRRRRMASEAITTLVVQTSGGVPVGVLRN